MRYLWMNFPLWLAQDKRGWKKLQKSYFDFDLEKWIKVGKLQQLLL